MGSVMRTGPHARIGCHCSLAEIKVRFKTQRAVDRFWPLRQESEGAQEGHLGKVRMRAHRAQHYFISRITDGDPHATTQTHRANT